MTFPLTVNVAVQVNTIDDLQKIMAMVGGNNLTTRPVQETVAPKAEVVKPKAEKPTEAPTPEPTEAPVQVAEPERSYADVSKLVVRVANEKGRDAATKLLAEFGLPNLKQAKPDQYDAIYNAALKAVGDE